MLDEESLHVESLHVESLHVESPLLQLLEVEEALFICPSLSLILYLMPYSGAPGGALLALPNAL
jgi:hypothetical protein